MKLSVTALLLIVAATLAHAHEVCSPGEKKKDDCNTCICVKGNWACTKMACPKVQEACKPGENKEDDCNTCVCVEGSVWACTLKLCPKPKAEGEKCSPGTTFKQDCNTCTCGPDGRPSACTLIACPPREHRADEESCKPGTTFLDDCNTCKCGPDGNKKTSACTLKACPRVR